MSEKHVFADLLEVWSMNNGHGYQKMFIPPQCTFLKPADQNFWLFFHRTWGNYILVQRIRIYEDEKNIMLYLSQEGKRLLSKKIPVPLSFGNGGGNIFSCRFLVFLKMDVIHVFCANMYILFFIQNHLHL